MQATATLGYTCKHSQLHNGQFFVEAGVTHPTPENMYRKTYNGVFVDRKGQQHIFWPTDVVRRVFIKTKG